MHTYVWSAARAMHEAESAEGRLAKGVQDLMSAERDQGRSSPPTPTIIGRRALLCLCFCHCYWLERSLLLTRLVKIVFVHVSRN